MELKYFKPSEFICKCGCGQGADNVSAELLEKLDKARGIAQISMVVTSGYRCKANNEKVGGVQESAHTLGKAADISINNGAQAYIMLNAFLNAGFKRIGIAKNFIHVDVDESKPQNVIWTY